MLVRVFSNVLLISIMAAMLIVLILLVKAVFKEKLSVRWHYYIWFLLIVRLLIPYTPEFSPKLNDIFPRIQDNTRLQTESNIPEPDTNSNADLKNNGEGNTSANSGYNPGTTDEMEASKNLKKVNDYNSKLKLTIVGIASKIWIIGILFFAFYIIIINCIMHYRIKKSSVSVQSCGIRNILDECKKLVNINGDIPVVYQKHIKTPAVCGVFKTKMLLPVDIIDQLSTDEIRYVVLHELYHFKRKDTIIGMLQMLLCILHWFNPLVWYAACKMKADREPVCDEMVLSCIKPDERRNYAETLVKVLKCFSEDHWIYSTANISQGSVANMEWRLRLMNILKKRSVILGTAIALVTITLGVVGVLIINGHLSLAYPVNSVSAGPVDTNPIAAALVSASDKELPTRGKILDRNGKELVVSIPADTITINPGEIKASGQDADSIAKSLADFLTLEKAEVLQKVTASSAYEIIKRQVDKEIGNKIREWVRNNNIKGVIIEEGSKRDYPYNNLAAHVIGFTGLGGQAGLTGVELSMEQYLKLKGTDVSVEGKKTLEGGMDVVLTIDAGVQGIVEKALDKAIKDYKTKNGALAIVIDPKSGEILAMASKPDFDLNMPYSAPPGVAVGTWKGNTPEDTKKLVDTVWRNKNLTDTFEPGSAFKAIISAIGLEEGVVTPETPVDDTPVSVAEFTIKCWNLNTHGKETFKEAVYNSCNPVFVKVAQSLGIDKFYTYMRDFGFYDKTGLELPGEAKSIIQAKPAEIDMAVASFGQRFQVTPIQLVSAYCAIANGGKLMKPQIIKQVVNTGNSSIETYESQVIRNVISPETSDSMKAILEGVVSKGTASNAYVEGYKIAGCIGTGEKANGQFIATFAGFAPADNPQIVCIIILDEPMANTPTGGMTAAPVSGEVMRDVLDYMSRN